MSPALLYLSYQVTRILAGLRGPHPLHASPSLVHLSARASRNNSWGKDRGGTRRRDLGAVRREQSFGKPRDASSLIESNSAVERWHWD